MGLRNGLYKAARALGDVNAAAKGKIGRRAGRRLVGKAAGRGMGKAGCFVATAVYGDPECWQVRTLREFRDRVLARSSLGQAFITFYYGGGGQRVAHFLRGRRGLVLFIRKFLDSVVANYAPRRGRRRSGLE